VNVDVLFVSAEDDGSGMGRKLASLRTKQCIAGIEMSSNNVNPEKFVILFCVFVVIHVIACIVVLSKFVNG